MAHIAGARLGLYPIWHYVTIWRLKGLMVTLVSLYIRPCLGASGENLDRLHRLVNTLESTHTYFIIIADWNMTPEQVPARLLERLRAITITRQGVEGTCRAGQIRMLDFLIVSSQLASGIRCHIDLQVPWKPHYGVGIDVAA